ncbi:MAG: Veg family protein [Clostridiales bacterium]|nr:Veg family protein [Clostridiales bacterium]
MIISSDIELCRKKFEEIIGRRVVLKTNGGRKRIITYVGVVECCYPNVFTVKCDRGEGEYSIVSFSYVDVLTRTVRIGLVAEHSSEEQAAG